MIEEIYAFLAIVSVRVGGNLEVQVTREQARALKLDPARFQQYERQAVETVRQLVFDPALLLSEGDWRHLHDLFWPPNCTAPDFGNTTTPCRGCEPSERRAAFEALTCYYRQLASMLERRWEEASANVFRGENYIWNSLVWQWDECQLRQPNLDLPCPLERHSPLSYLYQALAEFQSAQRPDVIKSLRMFLALPYWRKRWELYEVWFVILVLRSFGLERLELQVDNHRWRLQVGGVVRRPIAIVQMPDGRRFDFFYQFQGVPPQALVPDAEDRPELLVFEQGPENTRRCLLAVEVKARERRGFDMQAMKGATLALLEWSPMAILGGSYFQLSHGSTLFKQQFGGSQVVIADGCAPGSLVTSELHRWLNDFWAQVISIR